MAAGALVIACGALARELVEILRRNEWEHIRIQCLPAELHNRPERIPDAVAATIEKFRDDYTNIFVAYADCGTGGRLDKVLEKYDVERIPGAHCYEFFTGADAFSEFAEAEPGTFYLTDFLARHFDRLVVKGLGLDRHPELKDQYFGNYRRLVFLAQSENEDLAALARGHAEFLGLEYIEHRTGLQLVENIIREQVITWQN
ncbi:MAG: DUF1638 domain-containing protein [Proteobacteria bacterium]|nr:DUF1638 domain-containing protein [Pseudomonadota bacterium]MDA0992959.1 DUF1638 domain-containing protein [Pseudomonadota bacterium]